jgi:manganese oxidase
VHLRREACGENLTSNHESTNLLQRNASRARIKEAHEARKNRLEIVKALSRGQVSRRELIKWGLFTTPGLLAPIRGLSPFATSAYAANVGNGIPTGAPLSPLFGAQAFSQPMPRFDVLPRNLFPH